MLTIVIFLLPKMQVHQDVDHIINNGQRYVLEINNYQRCNDHIVYETHILDTAFNKHYKFYFRFKTLKQFHLQLIKEVQPQLIPEFPKTKSFGFWNRTNNNLKLIKQRMRELEYYLSKLFNNGRLLRYQLIKYLHSWAKLNTERRPSSYPMFVPIKTQCFENQSPDLYKRTPTAVFLL